MLTSSTSAAVHLAISVLVGVPLAAVYCPATADDAVPPTFAPVYASLERILDAELANKPAQKAVGSARPIVSLELLAANSNRGPALLRADTLDTVRLSLDRFKAIGAGSVKFALQYPLLRPDFPHAAEYLAFYKQVVKEAHSRDIKVMPHVTVLFADTPFSPFQGIYQGLDLNRFKREYRDMVHLIVRELHPDYLALITEPDTHARLTGLRELVDPPTVVDVVRFALTDLDRGKTLIGAGSGSWSPLAFAKGISEQTDVDFLGIHVYPITGPMLTNAREMARLAHAKGKKVFVDEAWLYKTLKPGGGNNVAAASDTFRNDAYSFWQPLDQKFVTLMLRLADEEQIGLVSFFWSNQMFGYIDYSAELEKLPYREATQRHNRISYANMREGKLSAVGQMLQKALQADRTGR